LIMQRFLYRLVRSNIILGLLWFSLCANAQPRDHTILVLGDSISAAYGMSLEQGWVALLAGRMQDKDPPYRVDNASNRG
jgi:acyl-CoA thioesterase-1